MLRRRQMCLLSQQTRTQCPIPFLLYLVYSLMGWTPSLWKVSIPLASLITLYKATPLMSITGTIMGDL